MTAGVIQIGGKLYRRGQRNAQLATEVETLKRQQTEMLRLLETQATLIETLIRERETDERPDRSADASE